VTVLLARNRPPPPTVAAGVPHAGFASELASLPSGLLDMVCEAIAKLKVRAAGVRACVRACRLHWRWERASRLRRVPSGVGAVLASLGMIGPYAEYWKYYLSCRTGCSSGVRCGPSRVASQRATKHTAGQGQGQRLKVPTVCRCGQSCQ
jgi:hypothetical protein